MKRSILVAIAALLLLPAVASTARAQGSSTSVAAESLFKEGRTLLGEGRYAEAADRFSKSQALEPSVGTLLSLGESYERLGRIASAWGAYKQAEALAITRRDPRMADAADRATRIENRRAFLTVVVDAPTDGLEITRNGERVSPATFAAAVPVDAGRQAIAASAPERRSWQTSIDVADGESKTVHVPRLVEAPRAPDAAGSPPGADAEGVARRDIALPLEVGGGIVLAGGLVAGGLALSRWSSVDDVCPNGHCRTDADRQRIAADASTAQTLATVSTIATGVGVAALVAGIVLHVTAPNRRAAIAPAVDRRFVGVTSSFVF